MENDYGKRIQLNNGEYEIIDIEADGMFVLKNINNGKEKRIQFAQLVADLGIDSYEGDDLITEDFTDLDDEIEL